MRDPVSTSALPDELAARLAALRGAPPASSAPAPLSLATPTSPDKNEAEQLADRLARLHTPTRREVERSVPVGVKGVGERELRGGTDEDEEVERFLREVEQEEGPDAGEGEMNTLLASSSPPTDPPLSLPSPPTSAPSRAPLARACRTIPALSPSLLDTLSGVEVQFFRPSLSCVSCEGDEGEEAELLRRVGDEAALEERVRVRDGEDAKGWEARLAGLRGVVPELGQAAGAGPSASAGTGVPALGAAPGREGVDEVERALRLRKRRGNGRGSGTEDEENSDDGTEDEGKSEEEDTPSEDSDAEDSDAKGRRI